MVRRNASKRFAATTLAVVAVLASVPSHADYADDVVTTLMKVESLRATGISPTHIYLQWTKPASSQETGFRIESSSTEDGIYETVTTAPRCQVPTACAQVLSFADSPADTTVRWFRVVPFIAVEQGPLVARTEVVPGKPSNVDPAMLGPLPPTNLSCNLLSKCEHTQNISLQWADNSDEQNFWVMRATGTLNPNFGGTFYAELEPNTTVYNETVNEVATSYTYKVTAVRKRAITRVGGPPTTELAFADAATNTTGATRQVVQVTTPPVQPPAAPGGLSATFLPPNQARLSWSDNAPGLDGFEEDGFYLEWGPKATQFESQTSVLKRSGTGGTSYTVTLPVDTKRCFRLRAYRYGPAYSDYTPSPSAAEPSVCVGPIPEAPSNLVASVVSNAEVALTWADRSQAESSFTVQRCAGAGCTSFVTIGSAPEDATSYSDTTTDPTTTYSYRVLASNATGDSAPSNVATVTTPVAPVRAPSGLSAVATGSHTIRLTWIDNSTNETGFRIEFQSSSSDEWYTLTEVGANRTSHDDSFGLAARTRRCYRLRALRGSGMSSATDPACATTLPPQPPNGAPSDLAVVNADNKTIDLSWTDNATNEDSFRIEYVTIPETQCASQNISGAVWRTLATVGAKAGSGLATYRATHLVPHSAYFFRVRAVNVDGESAASAVACGSTLGPRRALFIDPESDADIETTRCKIDIGAFVADTDRIQVTVIAKLATGWIVDGPITLEEPEPSMTGPGGRSVWRLRYNFRKGPVYAVRAVTVGYAPDRYEGALVELRDLKVLADCPAEL